MGLGTSEAKIEELEEAKEETDKEAEEDIIMEAKVIEGMMDLIILKEELKDQWELKSMLWDSL